MQNGLLFDSAKCSSLKEIDMKKGKKWRKKPGRNVELFQEEKVQILYKEVSEDRLTSNILDGKWTQRKRNWKLLKAIIVLPRTTGVGVVIIMRSMKKVIAGERVGGAG